MNFCNPLFQSVTMKIEMLTRVGFVVLGLTVLSLVGCDRPPKRLVPPTIPADAAQKGLELYDTNKNGFLDGAELDKAPALKSAMKELDKNGDGKISAEELDARIQKMRGSKVARVRTVSQRHAQWPGRSPTPR